MQKQRRRLAAIFLVLVADLVGNPEDSFFFNVAHLFLNKNIVCDTVMLQLCFYCKLIVKLNIYHAIMPMLV